MMFTCELCGRTIQKVYVSKKFIEVDNYLYNPDPSAKHSFDRINTEHVSGNVLEISYDCECVGGSNKVIVTTTPYNNDFWNDDRIICQDQLNHQKYGTLVVVKE